MVCVCGLCATVWIKHMKTLVSVHIYAFIFSQIMTDSKFSKYFRNNTHIYILLQEEGGFYCK